MERLTDVLLTSRTFGFMRWSAVDGCVPPPLRAALRPARAAAGRWRTRLSRRAVPAVEVSRAEQC